MYVTHLWWTEAGCGGGSGQDTVTVTSLLKCTRQKKCLGKSLNKKKKERQSVYKKTCMVFYSNMLASIHSQDIQRLCKELEAPAQNTAVVPTWWWETICWRPEQVNLLGVLSLSFGHIINSSEYSMQLEEAEVISLLSSLPRDGMPSREVRRGKRRPSTVENEYLSNIRNSNP